MLLISEGPDDMDCIFKHPVPGEERWKLTMDLANIVKRIPDYSCFLTVDELDSSTAQLAKDFPDRVEVSCVGHSRQGSPIQLIKIGHGSKNALVFACPHPNEPIGSLTVDFLTRELASNPQLEKELDYTWYFIKCIDIDGSRMNEGWFKGPFGITNYMHHYFRPAFRDQVEWTFPVTYKKLHFNSPIPETEVLMELIDTLHPEFMFSLHNLGFGGAYWYISKDIPELYPKFYDITKQMGVPRKLGEAETPYAVSFAPAVFQMMKAKDSYDYTERFTNQDPAAKRDYGTSSDEYANRDGKDRTMTFVCELPYFYSNKIDDTSYTDRDRSDVILESCDMKEKLDAQTRQVYDAVISLLSPEDNYFRRALDEKLGGAESIQAQRAWAKSPQCAGKATQAQMFDNLYVMRYFRCTNLCLLTRAIAFELDRAAQRHFDSAQMDALKKAHADAEALLDSECAYLEENMNYQITPIRNLVTVQVVCGLLTAEYVSSHS